MARARSRRAAPAAARKQKKKPTTDDRGRRSRAILRELHRLYPDADCALHHRGAFQLLVATILSAQSTDVTVNKVTPELFGRYPDPAALAAANPTEVEKIIHMTGFFRQKSKNIIGAARTITERFGGEVPRTMAELTELPGVARKTANVVLGTCFGVNEGIVVDTHVGRLADRLGLAQNHKDTKDAVRIEQDLMELVPRDDWTFCAHALIWHGRKVCAARQPRCEECTLAQWCPSAFTFVP